MTSERYAEITQTIADLFSQDRSEKTVEELFTDYFDSPRADAYFASLPIKEQVEYLSRIEAVDVE